MSDSDEGVVPSVQHTLFERVGRVGQHVVPLLTFPVPFAPLTIWDGINAVEDGPYARSQTGVEVTLLGSIGVLLWLTTVVLGYEPWLLAGRRVSKMWAATVVRVGAAARRTGGLR